MLVTGLAVTDLLGTCFLSPAVFGGLRPATARCWAWPGAARLLCDAFAFAMTFFGLASTLILFAMAAGSCLQPQPPPPLRLLTDPRRPSALPAIYAFCTIFAAAPSWAWANTSSTAGQLVLHLHALGRAGWLRPFLAGLRQPRGPAGGRHHPL